MDVGFIGLGTMGAPWRRTSSTAGHAHVSTTRPGGGGAPDAAGRAPAAYAARGRRRERGRGHHAARAAARRCRRARARRRRRRPPARRHRDRHEHHRPADLAARRRRIAPARDGDGRLAGRQDLGARRSGTLTLMVGGNPEAIGRVGRCSIAWAARPTCAAAPGWATR